MKNKKIKFNIIAILLIIMFCCAITPKSLQNDTFYTIKIGEYILENGITMIDPFSWHENLSYTFPHWAYDVLIYLIYNIGGHLGIYISTMFFTSILGVLLYLTSKKLNKNMIWSFVFTIAVIGIFDKFVAARAQLVTFILFVLTVNFIESFLETKKKRYIFGLIIIPILIANLHVAVFPFYFILYLPYIAEYIIAMFSGTSLLEIRISKIQKKMKKANEDEIEQLKEKLMELQKRKEEEKKKEPYKIIITKNDNTKILIILMIICLFAGFCTPLGNVPYTYLYNTMQGNSTQNISEHLPLTLAYNIKLVIVFILFIAILMFTDTKIRLCDLFMLGGLIFLTFWSRRQESMFLIICLPIFIRLLCAFINKYNKQVTIALEELIVKPLGTIITIGLIFIISLMAYVGKIDDEYISKKSYPIDAATWILENLDVNEIRLYNEYNYGSYLIYRGIPVFIDSRADLYLPEFNQDVNIFNDFLNISNLNIPDMESKMEEYDFTHLITVRNSKLMIYLDSNDDIYTQIYEDDYFCIYERNVEN